ncbi:Cytidylate kinase [Planctomycetes bacterium Pla163]|uniref:Cytidylate kinase n=1 Tax=Rohdeia mirabilis TaxID=2528008 RepID=A0A518D0D2_9BACT|nr:Cytidylate kinase [Planctomycetes bacterium Pla163]
MTERADSRSGRGGALPEIRLPVGTLAIGDLHVDVERPDVVEGFTRFLAAQHGRPCLIVLGDLFEYWIGKGQANSAGGTRCLAALSELAGSGTRILVVPGNRDFLLGASDARRGGFTLLADGFVGVAQDRSRTLVLHGDELCTRDTSYQRLRRVVRSGPVRWLARTLPTAASSAIAMRLREASTRAVARKPEASKRPQRDEALRRSSAANARTLLTGHVHEFRDDDRDGLRWLCVDAFGHAPLGPAAATAEEASASSRDAFELHLGGWRVRSSSRAGRPPGRTSRTDGPVNPEAMLVPAMTLIAIDGPSGVGKSTAARLLARRLDLFFLDTGAMYRAVARAVLERGADPHDEAACLEVTRGLHLAFEPDGTLLVDGEPAGPAIRTERVTRHVSPVSAHGSVRELVVARQREIAAEMARATGGAVAEGRDTTTVVFPNADLKVFLTASAMERARRRAAELGIPDEVGRILDDICRRDEHDSTRAHSPLRQADDAVRVETDGLTAEQVVERLAFLARSGPFDGADAGSPRSGGGTSSDAVRGRER